MTRSKRLGTLRTQSSTVTRAMIGVLQTIMNSGDWAEYMNASGARQARNPSGDGRFRALSAGQRPGHLVGRQGPNQLGDGPAGRRMAPAGHQLGQRQQYEGALGQARMRQYGRSRAGVEAIAVGQQVEVEGPGLVDHTTLPAEGALDRMEGRQQVGRR